MKKNRETAESKSQASTAPIFYSALARTIPDMKVISRDDGTVKGEMAISWLKARQKEGKFKSAEFEWSGVEEWLRLNSGRVHIQEIARFIEENGVQLKEIVKGDLGYQWSEDYAELMDGKGRLVGKLFSKDDGWWFNSSKGTSFLAAPLFQNEAISAVERDLGISTTRHVADTTRYAQYVLVGGENYRELLLTLPNGVPIGDYGDWLAKRLNVSYEEAVDGPEYEDDVLHSVFVAEEARRKRSYHSSHWDEPNVVAHIRFNDRTDIDGKRVLFIEELQSDWGQDGLRKGFAAEREEIDISGWTATEDYLSTQGGVVGAVWRVLRADGVPANNGIFAATAEEAIAAVAEKFATARVDGVPVGPFVTDTKSWLSLGIKRMIRYAAENDYDRIAFVNGQQSANRYDLSRQIKTVSYRKAGNEGTYVVEVVDNDGKIAWNAFNAKSAEIESIIGKDISKKIVDTAASEWSVLEGVDLRVGGEGMKTFYDKIVPQVANEVLRKLVGEKVGTVTLPRVAGAKTIVVKGHPIKTLGDSAQVGFEISEKLKAIALEGLPMFSKRFDLASSSDASDDQDDVLDNVGSFNGTETSQQDNLSNVEFDEIRGAEFRRFEMGAADEIGMSKIGSALAISTTVLSQRVSQAVESILRDGQPPGGASLNGASVLRNAIGQIALDGPPELRSLAATIENLLPVSGPMQIAVDDTRRLNLHGAVELLPDLRLTLFTAEGRNGLTHETVLHEALHIAVAVRYQSLRAGMVRANNMDVEVPGPAAAMALRQFEAVWEEFKESTAAEKFDDRSLELVVIEARSSPDEFFVRSLTDPVLQSYMAGKKYEGKTLWSRFKEWVKTSLLGLPESRIAPSWLDAALAASGDMARAMGIDKSELTSVPAQREISPAKERESMIDIYNAQPVEGVKVVLEQYTESEVEIANIEALSKGEGRGTVAMERIIALANQTGTDLMLLPAGEKGSEKFERLVAFYERFGFNLDGDVMRRAPVVPAAVSNRRVRENSPAFDTWFHESKVVDAAGKPLVVYHGTTAEFAAFEQRGFDLGFHFGEADAANDRLGADGIADGSNIMPVYLSIKNPLKLDDTFGSTYHSVQDTASSLAYAGIITKAAAAGFRDRYTNDPHKIREEWDDLQRAIEHAGYDGVLYENEVEGGLSWIAFHPEQIKSATNHNDFVVGISNIMAARGRIQEESPEFKAWFSDSKIVDFDGKPLVVYHGTKAGFEVFKPTGENGAAFGNGIYFTNSPKAAGEWAKSNNRRKTADGGNLMPVYLKMQNPAYFADEDTYFGRAGVGGNFCGMEEEREAFNDKLRQRGHDGLVVRRTLLPGKPIEYVVFRPEQIKSAIANNGCFDISNPDIMAARSRSQEDSPEFKKWFGNSKVVDERGLPLQIYHGTDADFTKQKGVLWMGSNPDFASMFADAREAKSGQNVVPLYAKIENPVDMRGIGLREWIKKGDLARQIGVSVADLDAALSPKTWSATNPILPYSLFNFPEFIRMFKRLGFDGVRWEETVSIREIGKSATSETWAAFSGKQVKSAIGNNGKFNPHSADMMLSAGRVQEESPEFKSWFNNSKIVDPAGMPLVVYHGTTRNIDIFRPEDGDGGSHFGTLEQANAFAEKTGGNIIPVYLSIEKLIRMQDGGHWENLREDLVEDGHDADGVVYLNRREGLSRADNAKYGLLSEMDKQYWDQEAGDDEFRAMFPSAQDSYIVFSASQIKSAICNNGAFDSNNPCIMASRVLTGPAMPESSLGARGATDGAVMLQNAEGVLTSARTAVDFVDSLRKNTNSSKIRKIS